MAGLRLLGFAWLMHVKMMSRSAFDGFLAILWPLFFATVAFFRRGTIWNAPSEYVASTVGPNDHRQVIAGEA